MRPEVLMIKCYRKFFGGADAKDAPVPGEDLDSAKQIAKARLLSFFEDKRFRTGEQPYTVSLIGEDNRVVATFRVQPTAKGGHEVVEYRDAPRPPRREAPGRRESL